MTKVRFTLALVLLYLCLVGFLGEVSAFKVETIPVQPENPEEGEVVNFTLTISDFPYGYILSFDTDLLSYNGNPIYNLTEMNKEVYERYFEINTTNYNMGFTVHMIGKVPEVTEVIQCDEITLIKCKKTTGYSYYRIELRDNDGSIIKANTKPFAVYAPEREEFWKNVNEIDDGELRNLLINMHEKGLVCDANELTDYLRDKPVRIPLSWFICSLIGVAFLFFVIGVRIGGKSEEE